MRSDSDIVQRVEQVTTTGSSWIVCRSKSRSGRVYYFNTLSGEATWNLSEAEMERARQRTKTIPNQEDLNIGGFPEPSEPLTDQQRDTTTHNDNPPTSIPSSTVYNKQVINNQYTKPQYPLTPLVIPSFNVVPVVQNPINHLYPIAMHSSNTGFNSHIWDVPPQQILFNPNLPIVNQPQPVNVQLTNQGQPPVNVVFHNQQPLDIPFCSQVPPVNMQLPNQTQQNNVPLNNQNIEMSQKTTPSISTHILKTKKSGLSPLRYRNHSKVFNSQSSRNNLSKFDLRKVLSAKKMHRRMSQTDHEKEISVGAGEAAGEHSLQQPHLSCAETARSIHTLLTPINSAEIVPTPCQILKIMLYGFRSYKGTLMRLLESTCSLESSLLVLHNEPEQNHDYISEYKQKEHDSNIEESSHSESERQRDADEDWIEENFLIEDGRTTLNVSNLKKLADSSLDPVNWFIVADMDILLHHLNFLIILCNSDDNCCLMVPQNVLVELQAAKESTDYRTATKAQRAVKFLLQHSDGENIVIADANRKETDTRYDYLLNCCINLLEQNYHVVLLSNDENFKPFKGSSQIPIFDIKELKQVLTKPKVVCFKKTDRLKPPPCLRLSESQPVSVKPIKITVTNELTTEQPNSEALNRSNDSTKVKETLSEDMTYQETEEIEPVDYSMPRTSDTSIKHISETEVLPDEAFYKEVHPIDSLSNESTKEASPKASLNCNNNETISPDNRKTASKVTNQNRLVKRDIRLNRSISKNLSSAEETPVKEDKKKFRWRKKRLASTSCSKHAKFSSAITSNVEENSKDVPQEEEVSTSTNDPEKLLNLESVDSFLSDVSSCKHQDMTKEKVIIEETSASEIISNTSNTVDSESESQPAGKNDFNQTQVTENVMFKVNNQKMERSLLVMNDEWLSRFCQIMEEVLTQVLRHDKQFLNKVVYRLHGGGPWSIQEATDCMKIKFKDHCDILAAADKLSNMFSEISDSTGRIIVNLSPSEFMELFSYGVHLVHSLVPALGNCDDLYTASQSLSKLLKDIKEPNLDLSHNDTFGDRIPQNASPKKSIDVPQSPNPKQKPSPSPSPTKKSPEKAIPQSPQVKPRNIKISCTQRVLRSRFKPSETSYRTNENQNTEQNVKFIRTFNIREWFFSNLNLVKKIPNNEDSSNTVGISKANTANSPDIIKSFSDNSENSPEPLSSKENTEVQVIRQFKFYPEFKNDLKNAKLQTVIREPLDMDTLDYSGYFEKDDDFEGNNETSHQYRERDVDFDHKGARVINLHDREINSFLTNYDGDNFEQNSPLDLNYTLDCIFSRIIGGVKDSIVRIKTFCERASQDLRGPVYTRKRQRELRKDFRSTKVMIDDLCKVVNSIYCREEYEPDNNIKALLRKAGINDFDFNDQILDLYKHVIGKCRKQAKILQESVVTLIMVIEKKPTSD